jgi:hypothetical protein
MRTPTPQSDRLPFDRGDLDFVRVEYRTARYFGLAHIGDKPGSMRVTKDARH